MRPDEAAVFLEEKPGSSPDQPARAALAVIASLLLNLDEAVTQE